MTQATSTLIKQSIATIADYPKPGIMFRDVTTLMANAEAFKATIDSFIAAYKDQGFTKSSVLNLVALSLVHHFLMH